MKTKIIFLFLIAYSESFSIEYEHFDNLCSGLLYQALPHPTNRNLFIGCHHEKAKISKCKNENEIFDAAKVACVDSTSRNFIEVQAEVIINDDDDDDDDHGHDDICDDLDDGLIPDPRNCTKFFICEDEEETHANCPSGQVFNPNNLICEAGDPATCEIFTTTTTTTTTTPGYENICYGIILGYIANPDNCITFFYCEFEVPHLRECPVGQVFNLETSNCEPGNPETCEIHGTTEMITSTEIPTTTEAYENICENITLGTLPDPSDCSSFYLCVLTTPIHNQCPPGEIFYENESICKPGNPETCEFYELTTSTENPTTTSSEIPTTSDDPTTSSTSTNPPTTSTTSSEITTTESIATTTSNGGVIISFECPQDVTSNGLLLPHAIFCERYYECIFGVAYLRTCPDGLYFDVISRTCVDPAIAFCGNYIRCHS